LQTYHHSQSSSFQEKGKSLPPRTLRTSQEEKPSTSLHQSNSGERGILPTFTGPIREKQTATAYASHLKDGLPTFTGPIREKQTAIHTLSRNSRRIPADNRQQTNRQTDNNIKT